MVKEQNLRLTRNELKGSFYSRMLRHQTLSSLSKSPMVMPGLEGHGLEQPGGGAVLQSLVVSGNVRDALCAALFPMKSPD